MKPALRRLGLGFDVCGCLLGKKQKGWVKFQVLLLFNLLKEDTINHRPHDREEIKRAGCGKAPLADECPPPLANRLF